VWVDPLRISWAYMNFEKSAKEILKNADKDQQSNGCNHRWEASNSLIG
jgi:hypothetical protein